MPFKSQSQAKFMFSQKPAMAQEMASKTKSIKTLPKKVGGAKGYMAKKGMC